MSFFEIVRVVESFKVCVCYFFFYFFLCIICILELIFRVWCDFCLYFCIFDFFKRGIIDLSNCGIEFGFGCGYYLFFFEFILSFVIGVYFESIGVIIIDN